ncbi:hypothetical protein CA54_60390 [Symmachiella macrocystis]|uniref:Uncharacterized protein n=1 Tax=Symmachiella macrocystis TaxID=2527985 RepID=A0A5C6AXB8_9PLAN|nr:hypothetical protein CA54_60390 [Symmachiella macrocystis]
MLWRARGRACGENSALRDKIECLARDFWLTEISLFVLTGGEC